jgi:hypothetical protein
MNLDTDSQVPVQIEIGLACKEGGEAPEEGGPLVDHLAGSWRLTLTFAALGWVGWVRAGGGGDPTPAPLPATGRVDHSPSSEGDIRN